MDIRDVQSEYRQLEEDVEQQTDVKTIPNETQHSQVYDNQQSTTSFNSSDYASCGNYKKGRKRSNSSSHSYLDLVDGEGVAGEETHHSHVDVHQQRVTSFNSSAYASCGSYKKSSKRSNASSHTYAEIDENRRREAAAGDESYKKSSKRSNASSHTYAEVDENRRREAAAGDEKTELKKRNRFSKKYPYIYRVVLVVAIISVGVAYLLSTSNMNDKLRSQVKEGVNELPNKEYMKQVVSNVTDVEYLAQVVSNVSNMGMKEVQAKMDVLLKDLPAILSDVADRNLSIHSVMNELKVGLANQTKEVHQLAGKLSQIADKENMEQVISNITKEGMKYAVTDIRKELPDKEYIKQVVTNITKEEMKNTVNLLMKDKEHLELVVANITTEEVKNYMDVVKKDIYDLTKDIKKHLYKFINGTRCISSCSGLADGNYQSCHTCEGYISCVGGALIPRRCQPHHPNQTVFWDDFEKRCNFVSYTCDTKYVP